MKYKKIIAFGDSFVEGQIKLPYQNTDEEMARINFVTKLGERFNIPVLNYGFRGNAQNGIAFDVHTHIKKYGFDRSALYLVVWSGYSRKQAFNLEQNNYKNWKEQSNTSNVDLHYLNNINIRGTYSLLEDNKQPFLMLSSFINFFDVDELNLNKIRDKWVTETLFEMCAGKKQVVPDYHSNHDNKKYYTSDNKNITECMHPSEEGHKVIANILSTYIETTDDDYIFY